MLLVICGPSGTGKGTVVDALVAADPDLDVSRSWTTRPRRRREADDAYEFVGRPQFEAAIDAGHFLEWAEVFAGHLYGTPRPDPRSDRDLVLEIDVQGAAQVRERVPGAVIVLLLPPDREEQARRLRRRGDLGGDLPERLAMAEAEEEAGRALADHVVVNHDVAVAVEEVAGIVAAVRAREAARASPHEPTESA
ncbi:MAG TPA: guanylate kinase [Acidimicrobiales bacterium]